MTVRIRRTRPAPVTRVRRVRAASALTAREGKPRYIVDWTVALGGKLQLYLMASFLYYEKDVSLITDSDYDKLCHDLLVGWRDFQHQHKHCVTRAHLRAGTGYGIEYPLMVQKAAEYMCTLHSEV